MTITTKSTVCQETKYNLLAYITERKRSYQPSNQNEDIDTFLFHKMV